MLGINSFSDGALMGLRLGLAAGLLNVITFQLLGTGTISWASSKALGAGGMN
tara:strand:+ start:1009 stop:1164 length:156 start_codon:yes stop_codon:yes gene_type:complete